MDWLERAATLNRTGATLCNSGLHVEALCYFRNALEVMAVLMKGHEELYTTCFSKPPQYACEYSMASPQKCLLLTSDAQVRDTHLKETIASADLHGEDLHFIYREALVFETASYLDPRCLFSYIEVIEFNMALSIHLRSPHVGETALIKALHVYDCCLEHIKPSGCYLTFSQVMFAALNNKAAILYDLSSFEESRKAMEALIEAITCSKDAGVLDAIDSEELDGLLLNALLLRRVSSAPAA